MEGPNPKGNMSDFDKVCEGRSGRTGLQEAPEDVARESKLWADPQRRLDAFQRPEAYRLEPCYLVPSSWESEQGAPHANRPFSSSCWTPWYRSGSVATWSQSTLAWLNGQWIASGRLLISATQGNGSSEVCVAALDMRDAV
ncbi:hypothetical protein FALBO_4924 [Fusarium albosuccineum]|uniref:Uncharacterized protein n=1 Tax=Fusarium albosuccineum TaxID=1237068 RepID=A0A8H4LHI1_9HYPO|nr:hypothetical protein FALBO_4924 [Fusarium albosuccineum]